ncbi:MAG: Crp/Fnr family transcriptional regulator [Gammaproteobacteria bacterium]|nr:Crp/Fnr family transcriptional regulator [Gammaproteobacteria bacterium]
MENKPLLKSDASISAHSQLYKLYPELEGEHNPEWIAILDRVQLAEGCSNTILAATGSLCMGFMLLLDGTIRVYQDADDGRETTLYRINPGDICLMSLNSLLHNKPFRANAKAESNVRMLMMSAPDFHKAMGASEIFRTLMLTSLVDTMCSMVGSFYDTAFEPLDMRLACLLGRLFERSGTDALTITHQELSQELGTSREVISRLLKKLELQQCVVLKRGQILIGDNKNLPGLSTE